ncbi:MAG: SMI1/KNR4 family protein [bacterium]|nr:SMI1/KNR4 family protein [bacterium]
MTPDELDRIEFELSITLPELYRRAVDPYPIPALARNTDWMFWDDAEALIALNRRMREGKRFRDPWPARFYALGEDAGGCSEPLDLLTEVPGSSARGSRGSRLARTTRRRPSAARTASACRLVRSRRTPARTAAAGPARRGPSTPSPRSRGRIRVP